MPLGIEIFGEGKPQIKSADDPSWSGISLPWMSHGYEVQMTPLQILAFYNSVANDGVMVKPKFAEETRKYDKVIETFDPIVVNEAICSKATIKKVHEMLNAVVEYGTIYTSENPLATVTVVWDEQSAYNLNVTTANTFEEWRVKTNELGTAVGNLTNLTEPLAGATDIVSALADHETRTEALDLIVGTAALWDTTNYGTLRKAANKNHADITTLAATAGIDLANNSLSGYNGSETTLVAILNAQYARDGAAVALDTTATTLTTGINEVHTETNTNTTALGTISAAAMGTTAATIGPAILELHGEVTTATSNIAGLGATYVALAGDTMTGTLITASSGLSGSTAGVSAATLLTFGTGSSTAMQINSSQRIGIGTSAHASHKVDVSGSLNATTLSYGGTDLKSVFHEQGESFQDAVGAMLGGTETGGISVTYDDANNHIDFAIADDGHNHVVGNIDNFAEEVQDVVGVNWISW